MKINKTGVFLIAILASVVVGAAYAALEFGLFRGGWEFAGWLAACIAFIAAGVGLHHHRSPKNGSVYGAAQPASEADAQNAARGNVKSAALHEQTFRD